MDNSWDTPTLKNNAFASATGNEGGDNNGKGGGDHQHHGGSDDCKALLDRYHHLQTKLAATGDDGQRKMIESQIKTIVNQMEKDGCHIATNNGGMSSFNGGAFVSSILGAVTPTPSTYCKNMMGKYHSLVAALKGVTPRTTSNTSAITIVNQINATVRDMNEHCGARLEYVSLSSEPTTTMDGASFTGPEGSMDVRLAGTADENSIYYAYDDTIFAYPHASENVFAHSRPQASNSGGCGCGGDGSGNCPCATETANAVADIIASAANLPAATSVPDTSVVTATVSSTAHTSKPNFIKWLLSGGLFK